MSKVFIRTIFTTLIATLLTITTSCGAIKSTIEGTKSSKPNSKNTIEVAVTIESNSGTAEDVKIEVNSRKDPVTLTYESVTTPFRQSFNVPSDIAFPLRSTRITAQVPRGGDTISCTIRYDDDTVATYRAEGTNAIAKCEKKLTLGPQ